MALGAEAPAACRGPRMSFMEAGGEWGPWRAFPADGAGPVPGGWGAGADSVGAGAAEARGLGCPRLLGGVRARRPALFRFRCQRPPPRLLPPTGPEEDGPLRGAASHPPGTVGGAGIPTPRSEWDVGSDTRGCGCPGAR